MANEERTLQDAITLYNEKEYFSAAEICLDLRDEGVKSADVNFLLAKSYLQMIKNPKDDAIYDFLSVVGETYAAAESVHKCFEYEAELLEVYQDWIRSNVKREFANIESTFIANTWIHLPVKLATARLHAMHLQFTLYEYITEEWLAEEGCDREEAVEKYRSLPKNEFSDEEFDCMLYKAAIKVFEKAVSEIKERGSGTKAYIQMVCEELNGYIWLANNMAMNLAFENDAVKTKNIEILLFCAQVLTYYLEATLYIIESPMSIMVGMDDREANRSALEKIYNKISSLDDEFIAPNLPRLTPVIPAFDPTPTQSGGCYVATAVYGSYDCPEVWTLRRFRDYQLAESVLGRWFIKTYYFVSPSLVKWFGDTVWFKNMFKPILNKLVCRLKENGVEDTPYNDRHW